MRRQFIASNIEQVPIKTKRERNRERSNKRQFTIHKKYYTRNSIRSRPTFLSKNSLQHKYLDTLCSLFSFT